VRSPPNRTVTGTRRLVGSSAPGRACPNPKGESLTGWGEVDHDLGASIAVPVTAESRLLDDSGRTGVRPDSVQVLGGTLFSRLPTQPWVWLSIGLRAAGHRVEAWLQRGLPSS
jgi:hypothetical protein